jgi:hypothetical protein
MLLVYYRLYITHRLSEFYLILIRTTSTEIYLSILEPPVKRCIPLPEKLYIRTRRRLRTIDEVEEYFLGFMVIESTKQEIPRPKNKFWHNRFGNY